MTFFLTHTCARKTGEIIAYKNLPCWWNFCIHKTDCFQNAFWTMTYKKTSKPPLASPHHRCKNKQTLPRSAVLTISIKATQLQQPAPVWDFISFQSPWLSSRSPTQLLLKHSTSLHSLRHHHMHPHIHWLVRTHTRTHAPPWPLMHSRIHSPRSSY